MGDSTCPGGAHRLVSPLSAMGCRIFFLGAGHSRGAWPLCRCGWEGQEGSSGTGRKKKPGANLLKERLCRE